MKITAVTAYAVRFDQGDFFGGAGHADKDAAPRASSYLVQPGWRGIYSPRIESMVVRVDTDAGLFGYGEGASPIAPEVSGQAVRRILAPVLTGRDPCAPRALRREMYDLMNLRGHAGGSMIDAISAVDQALWDIAGKAAGLPVHALLGGPGRLDLPVYVSGIRGVTIDERIATMRGFMSRGFSQFKHFGGFGVERDAETIGALIDGADGKARIAIDALWNYDVTDAVRLGRRLERLDALWLEAPIEPEDVRGNAELARALDLTIANGETLRTRLEFLPWFEARAFDLAQPDIGRSGITEGVAIIDLAEAFHIPVALHLGTGTPVMVAASLHVAAASPQVKLVEYQPVVLAAANRLLKQPISCEGGRIRVPEGPGLGIEVDEAVLRNLSVPID